jgi:hypothetical protein
MRTLTATAVISPNHTLTMQVPADLTPGVHEVVVLIQEPAALAQSSGLFRDWPAHNVGLIDPSMTFRREDLYGDDGR